MYLLKRSLLVSLWFAFLTIPILALRLDTTNEILVWRWHYIAIVAGAAFVLYMVWLLCLRYKDRQRQREDWAIAPTPSIFSNLTQDKRLSYAVGVIPVICIIIPFVSSSYETGILTNTFIYIILGLGLNIVVGYAGQLALGYAAFYAMGAYTFALLNVHYGVSFWMALPISAVTAGIFGMLLSLPVVRLRGDYLAIVTLGFGEITRIVLENWTSLTNGPNGFSNIPKPGLFGMNLTLPQMNIYVYFIAFALALLSVIVLIRLKNSRTGRAWLALSQDETAAEIMGINTTLCKLSAFTLSAMWGGVAGVLFATKTSFINPVSFTFMDSALFLCIVVLGGMGSVYGIVLGAAAIVLLPEYLRAFSDYRMLIFGAAMVLMMIFRPQGLVAPRARTYTVSKLAAKKGATP